MSLVDISGRPITTMNFNMGKAIEQPELDSCPFCGGKAELKFDERISMYYVTCLSCKVETDVANDKDTPVKNWNRRVG